MICDAFFRYFATDALSVDPPTTVPTWCIWCACFFISRRENFVPVPPLAKIKLTTEVWLCDSNSKVKVPIQPYRTVLRCILCCPAPVELNSADIKTIYYSIPQIKHAHQLAVERLVNLTAIVKIVRVRPVAMRPRCACRIARKRRSLTQQQILEAGLVLSEGKHE